MIVLDLEWNRSYDKTPLNEILQIGAVRVGRLGGPVLDSFNVYIRPTVHKRFDPGAKALPELNVSRTSQLRFPAAMKRFSEWCGPERTFALWGGDDFEVLGENCKYWGLPVPEAENVYDLQTAFSHMLGTDQQIALWRAADYCRIPDTFTFHNALNDALYTSILGGWITPEALAWKPVPKEERLALKRFSRRPFPCPPRQEVGPFPDFSDGLNAKTSRKPVCPLCGAACSVAQWNIPAFPEPGVPQRCYSPFSCPEHGCFLCQLTLTPDPDGAWSGYQTVPVVTPELAKEYAAVLRGGKVHACKSRRRRRRRRRTSAVAK